MTSGNHANAIRRRPGLLVGVALALAAAGALFAGCSSDETNQVGAGITGPIAPGDPQFVTTSELAFGGQIEVRDDTLSYDERQVLYLGRQGEEESAILARYDFSAFADTFWNDVEFSADNVTVNLRLFMLEWFFDLLPPSGSKGLVKEYEIYDLADSLDASLYPGPAPAVSRLIASETEASSELIQVPIPFDEFLAWLQVDHKGILIREGDSGDSEEGLVGFASTELRLYDEIGLEQESTVVGPILKIEFAREDTTVVLAPVADVSTLENLTPPPASIEDGFMLRTHVRDYPYFSFDLSNLPEQVRINRATLFMWADSTLGYGPKEAIVLNEVPTDLVNGAEYVTLDDLIELANPSSGQTNVDPASTAWVGIDVTASFQRVVNGVIVNEISYLLTGGEDFTGIYDVTAPDPDFYLSRFVFAGTAADTLRPYLEITYSEFGTGGGEG